MKYGLLILTLAMYVTGMAQVRQEINLSKWFFSRDGSSWKQVDVPHDLSLIHI